MYRPELPCACCWKTSAGRKNIARKADCPISRNVSHTDNRKRWNGLALQTVSGHAKRPLHLTMQRSLLWRRRRDWVSPAGTVNRSFVVPYHFLKVKEPVQAPAQLNARTTHTHLIYVNIIRTILRKVNIFSQYSEKFNIIHLQNLLL